MRNNFDINAKLQVENAISMMDMADNLVAKGYMKPAEARDAAVSLLRDVRYGKDGYFCADTRNGDNVVLYGLTKRRERTGLISKMPKEPS